MLEQAQRFAHTVVEPSAAAWETERRFPRTALDAAARDGLCGLFVPTVQGGAGLTTVEAGEVLGVVAAADMAVAFSLVCHNNLAGALARRGSNYHRETYLDSLLNASSVGAFLLTEPGTGSDAAAITTRATETAAGWLLNGEKAWVTNGTDADVMNCYVQTQPGSGAKGIAAFLVEADQPGVDRLPAYEMLGAHATGTAGFGFTNVEVDRHQLFLEPGVAFKAALSAIDLARVMVAFMCCGMIENGLQLAVDRLRQRQAFDRPLADQQGLRWMLADVATDLRAARSLALEAAERVDAKAPDAAVASAHAKKFATRVALTSLSQCMQALGADGFRHPNPLPRHLAAAKMAHYLDGTTEIQNIVIARDLFN